MVKLAPLASAPSEHWTVLPVIRQPPVGDATLVTPAGMTSFTAKPELLPGPLLVTVRVQVMVAAGATRAGAVLVMPRSTGWATQAAPSLLDPATGPV